MKKAFLAFILFSVMVNLPGHALARDLFSVFPDLEAQIGANLDAGTDRGLIVSRLKEYCNTDDPESLKGMEMVLAADRELKAEPNFALQLLFHLLREKCYAPGDTMVLALALANNRLYAAVNDEIRREIKKDLVRHWSLYRKIVAWQRKFEIRIDLGRMPLVPKIYWADRMAYPPEGIHYPVKTLDDYREYVDSIETLEYFHDLADRHRLYEGGSVKAIGSGVYAFIHRKDRNGLDRDFYGPTPEQVRPFIDRIPHDAGYDTVNDKNQIMYKGRWRNINGFIYLNYQRALFQGLGRFIGLCEVFGLTEMAMFKAMGIPSGLMIHNSPKEVYGGHVFAMYYDPFRRRWNNLEIIRSSNRQASIGLAIGKPLWHHRLKGLKEVAEEKETAPRFFRLLDLGIQEKHFNAVFFSTAQELSGTIFSREALPDELVDGDGDTILDFEEKLLGLDPSRADTLRDGVSDLWKLEHGFDPKAPLASREVPPVDGLGGGYDDHGTLQTTRYGPYGGAKEHDEIQAVKAMSAARYGDTLYLSVSFHNDVSKNKRRAHRLTFNLLGGRGSCDSFELQIEGNNPRLAPKGVIEKSPDGFGGISGWAIRQVELAIPVRYLDDAGIVRVRYWGFVRKEGRSVDSLMPSEIVYKLRGDDPLAGATSAFITNRETGKSLHAGAVVEDGSPVGLSSPLRQEDYRWRLVPAGERDQVLIVSDNCWKSLTVDGAGVVVLGSIGKTGENTWRLEKGADGYYRLLSKKHGAPLAVGVSDGGKEAVLSLDAFGANQHWGLQAIDSALERMEREPTVGIVSSLNGMALDLYGGKTEDGAAVKLWQRTGNRNQQWKLVSAGGDGWVYIVAVGSMKCLTAREEKGSIATVQTAVSGDAAQKWRPVAGAAGTRMLVNKEFNKALGVDESRPSSREVRFGEADGAPARLWRLE